MNFLDCLCESSPLNVIDFACGTIGHRLNNDTLYILYPSDLSLVRTIICSTYDHCSAHFWSLRFACRRSVQLVTFQARDNCKNSSSQCYSVMSSAIDKNCTFLIANDKSASVSQEEICKDLESTEVGSKVRCVTDLSPLQNIYLIILSLSCIGALKMQSWHYKVAKICQGSL